MRHLAHPAITITQQTTQNKVVSHYTCTHKAAMRSLSFFSSLIFIVTTIFSTILIRNKDEVIEEGGDSSYEGVGENLGGYHSPQPNTADL